MTLGKDSKKGLSMFVYLSISLSSARDVGEVVFAQHWPALLPAVVELYKQRKNKAKSR